MTDGSLVINLRDELWRGTTETTLHKKDCTAFAAAKPEHTGQEEATAEWNTPQSENISVLLGYSTGKPK